MAERIQLSRAKGWRMPPNTVKVTRPGKWGNPFNLKSPDHCWTAIAWGFRGDPAGRQAASVAMFRDWITTGKALRYEGCGLYVEDAKGKREPISVGPTVHGPTPPSLTEIRSALGGKNLACWCKPGAPCHADVLLELANAEPSPATSQVHSGAS